MFQTTNRNNTNAIKWEKYRAKELLPMWVADMDIASPPAIVEALTARASHPVYGYTHPWQSLNDAVVNWCAQQYQWPIDADWVVWMPGVVPSFNLAVDLFGKGGRVIVQTPNYPPMLVAAERQGCETVAVPVTWQNNGWHMDWAMLEQELAHKDCHLFILCNPMNPNGAVLTKQELLRIADLCNKYNVFLCSDEIHCDLIMDNIQHTPAGSLSELANNSVTLMAASKTFNVAGLGCSFAIIPDVSIRNNWQNRMTGLIPHPNFMGYIAAETAFTECSDWHHNLLKHLRTNRAILDAHLNGLEGIIYRPSPATFLAWIESSNGLALDKHFIRAGIIPSEGKFFGQELNVRLNFGTGTDTIEQAMQMLTDYWGQMA